MNRRRKIIVSAFAVGAVGGLAWLFVAVASISRDAGPRMYESVIDIPVRQVGVLLGCAPTLSDGRQNLYFRYRMEAAADLYQSDKIKYILVSGDNGTKAYDEPTAMQQALIELGVPQDRIVLDYAGFEPWIPWFEQKKFLAK